MKQLCNKIGWSYFLLTGVMLGAVNLLSLLLIWLAPKIYDNNNTAIILSCVCIYAVAMPICWKLLKTVPAKQLYQNKIGAKQWIVFFSITIFIIYVGGIVGSVVSALVGKVPFLDTTNDLNDVLLNENLILTLVLAVFVGPFFEELFFRKLLIDRVIIFGDKAAILISGLMFGLFHGNFAQFFYAFGLGCLFAYVYIRTGKLAYSVSLHMAINFLNGFVEVLMLRKLDFGGMYFGDFLAGNTLMFLMNNLPLLGMMILYGIFMIVMFFVGLVNLVDKIRKVELRPGECSMPFDRILKMAARTVGFWMFIVITVVLFVFNMLP